ncbi:MAG: CpaF/VirB11 family protein [Acidimicrobiia bacterium]
MVNCLLNMISKDERVVTIEETPELLCDHPQVVKLVARFPNSDGKGNVSLRDLVKASLRMRPDRIVLGEVRSVEAFDLMQALNTGHDGSICTLHANGPYEVIDRLASLAILAHKGFSYEAITRQFYMGIDVIIFTNNVHGMRQISSISEIDRSSNNPKIIQVARPLL